MSILDNITTATHVNLQPGDVLFLNVSESSAEQIEQIDIVEVKQSLSYAFGREVKFILTYGIVPTVVSPGGQMNFVDDNQMVSVPSTRFQRWKLRNLPKWLLHYWPVRYELIFTGPDSFPNCRCFCSIHSHP